MKKFAAVCMSALLVGSMAVGSVASAATVLTDDKGDITLTKYEQTVAGQNNGTPVKGATFTAYKVANLNSDGLFTPVTKYEGVKASENGDTLGTLLSKDKYGTNSGGYTYTDSDAFEALIPNLQKESTSDTGKDFTETTDGTYTLKDLELGVYLVVETKVPGDYTVASQSFLVSLPSWNNETKEWEYSVKASPKDTPIAPTKKIVSGGVDKDAETYKIGDTVNYKVTANLPFYGDTLPTEWTEATVQYPTVGDFNTKIAAMDYALVDTMESGLTYDNNSVKVMVAGVTDPISSADYTVSYEANVLKVDFDWSKINQYQGKEVTVTYTATLNDTAKIGSANVNTAKVQYVVDPQKATTLKDSKSSSTSAYTYGMNLTKTFNNKSANDANVDASSVKFTLSKDGKNLVFVQTSAGNYTAYSDTLATTLTGTQVTEISPATDGTLNIRGLNLGEYTLVETESADGYGKLSSDVKILVKDKATGDPQGTVVATIGDQTLSNVADTGEGQGIFKVSINNTKKQFNLPVTGGMGILLFTIGGGIVIAGAIIIFSNLRKKKTSK